MPRPESSTSSRPRLGTCAISRLRALEVLAEVDLIACEDTRHSAHLLAAHGISRPLISYFEHNEEARAKELTEKLRQGAKIALVTDAGTPAISDPGYRLVRAALQAGCAVRTIPGPSALIAALSISGLPTDRFTFEGFLPSRDGPRKARLRELKREVRTMVFYEAARRLPDALADLTAEFGSGREAAVVRELTKVFEEVVRGPLGHLADRWKEAPPKGEITLVVSGAPGTESHNPDVPGFDDGRPDDGRIGAAPGGQAACASAGPQQPRSLPGSRAGQARP